MNNRPSIFIALLCVSTLVTACGGRAANPVMVQQYGDQKKSCTALETEMVGIQQEVSRLQPETSKGGKNTALGVAGAFLIIPWFFMDLSHAEQEEINAYRNRYNSLASMAADKGCDLETTTTNADGSVTQKATTTTTTRVIKK